MAGYTITADIGDESSDVAFATGGVASGNVAVDFNDGVTREDAIRTLEKIVQRMESTIDDEPPAAFS